MDDNFGDTFDPGFSRPVSDGGLPNLQNLSLTSSSENLLRPTIQKSSPSTHRKSRRTNVGSTNKPSGRLQVGALTSSSQEYETSKTKRTGRSNHSTLDTERERKTKDLSKNHVHSRSNSDNMWLTEHQSKIGGGKLEFTEAQKLLEATLFRNKAAQQARAELMINKARKQLDRIAREKYGSVQELFRMFDTDKSGEISIDEFSLGIKKRNLEPLFPREQQRALFDHIDKNGDTKVTLSEFINFFEEFHELGRDTPKRTPATSSPPKPRDLEVEKLKDRFKQQIIDKKRRQKLEDGYAETTGYLINAFRQIDDDQTGNIYYDNFKKALGPSGLNLGFTEMELSKLFDSLDSSHDGKISYYEFTKGLQMSDAEAHFNPFLEHKQKHVKQMIAKAKQPWPYDMTVKEMKEKYHHFLGKDQPLPRKETPPASPPERDTVSFLSSTASLDFAESVRNSSMKSLQSSSYSTGLNLGSSQDLFDEMNQTQMNKLGSIVKRISPPPPTDWTRVGYGKNGTDELSGMFIDPSDQYKTTSKDFFPDLVYAPSQPVSRNMMSETEKLAEFKKKKFEIIKQRQKEHIDRIFTGIEMEETIKKMQRDARVQKAAKSIAEYCQFAYAEDLKNQTKMPLSGIQKKTDNASYTRMWGGSADSQFNANKFPTST